MKTYKDLDDTGAAIPEDLMTQVSAHTARRNRKARVLASTMSMLLVAVFAATALALAGSSSGASGVKTAGADKVKVSDDTESTVVTTTTMAPTTTVAPTTVPPTTVKPHPKPPVSGTIIPGGLDINGDGIVDYPKVKGGYDTNGDGIADYTIIKTGLDVNGDGIADYTCHGHRWDRNHNWNNDRPRGTQVPTTTAAQNSNVSANYSRPSYHSSDNNGRNGFDNRGGQRGGRGGHR
jgi:hypothetical protein